MAHSDSLISRLESDIEDTIDQWKGDEQYHEYLYKRYLDLANVLHSTSRRLRAVPLFHRLRNFAYLRQNHADGTNLAAGSGTRRQHTGENEGEVEAKKGRSAEDRINHTSENLALRTIGHRHVKQFDLTSRQFDMRLRNLDKVENLEAHMESCFDEAIQYFLQSSTIYGHDKLGIEVDYPGLKLNAPILINFRNADMLNGWTIMRAIARVLQSNQSVNMADPLSITFTQLKMPIGGGRGCLKFNFDTDAAREHYGQRNGHLLAMRKGDLLCFPKCIIIAQRGDMYRQNLDTRLQQSGRLVREARDLLRRAGILHNGPCSLEDIQLIQDAVPERILVFDRSKGHACIWDGHKDQNVLDDRRRIILQLHEDHFDLIKSLPAFFGSKQYCYDCMCTYHLDQLHKCKARCCFCLTRSMVNCICDGTIHKCPLCNRTFKSQLCFNNHKIVFKKKSACNMIKRCVKCGFRVVDKKHVCGEHYCCICEKKVKTENHVCFVQKFKEPKKAQNYVGKEIFFDFESCFITGNNGIQIHKPIFACAQVQCASCSQRWNRDVGCDSCNEPPEVFFEGHDTLRLFCRWLFSDNHKHSVAIAHNLKNYDGQLITAWLTAEAAVEFKIIPRGLSILHLECNSIRVICSTNFLAVALRKLPAMFKFEKEILKGEFPYRLLTDIGQLSNEPTQWPCLELYDPDSRSPPDRAQLQEWHNTVKDCPFHLIDQLRTYCQMDVTILRMAMTAFRDMFKSVSQIHPYEKTFTIASACLASFRKNNMPENSLMVYKERGPRKTSKKCMRWISIMERRHNVRIRSSLSTGGEYRLQCGNRKFIADGVVQDEAGTVTRIYEFYGCYFHGCQKCFLHCQQAKWNGGQTTFGEKHEETISRMDLIRIAYPNAEITELWEHELDNLLEAEPIEQIFQEPLDPRSALFGGRVEVCQLQGESSDPTTAASYIDVASLYKC